MRPSAQPVPAPLPSEPAVLREFKRRRRIMLAVVTFWVLGGTPLLLFTEYVPIRFAQAVAFGSLFAGALLFWKWRCPACSTYLGGAFATCFCGGCGATLVAPREGVPVSAAPPPPPAVDGRSEPLQAAPFTQPQVGSVRLHLQPVHLRATEQLVVTAADGAPRFWAERQRRPAREAGGVLGTLLCAVGLTYAVSQLLAALPGELAAWHLVLLACVFFGALLAAGHLLAPARHTRVYADAARTHVALELVQRARRLGGPVFDVHAQGERLGVIEGTVGSRWTGGPYVLRSDTGAPHLTLRAEPRRPVPGPRALARVHVLSARSAEGREMRLGTLTREPGVPAVLEPSPTASEDDARCALALVLAQWLGQAG